MKFSVNHHPWSVVADVRIGDNGEPYVYELTHFRRSIYGVISAPVDADDVAAAVLADLAAAALAAYPRIGARVQVRTENFPGAAGRQGTVIGEGLTETTTKLDGVRVRLDATPMWVESEHVFTPSELRLLVSEVAA